MTRANKAVGAYGERVALLYLLEQGMLLLERNWRGKAGEIDIILRDGDSLVFCEVKTRRSEIFGQPIEAIVPGKVERIRRVATQWLVEHEVLASPIRFDVLSVRPQSTGAATVEHLRGAF